MIPFNDDRPCLSLTWLTSSSRLEALATIVSAVSIYLETDYTENSIFLAKFTFFTASLSIQGILLRHAILCAFLDPSVN